MASTDMDPLLKPRSNILLKGEDDVMEEEEEEDEDEDVLFDNDKEGGLPQEAASVELISTIITPSPFPHHTTGPTSSRFRNAIARITTAPASDVEAWQALITEVGNCYRSIQPKIHSVDAEIQLQLDWIESCYGALLKYFPYSSLHYCAVAEILVAQSAQVGEEHGPLVEYGHGVSVDHRRRQTCEAKLHRILEITLGIQMDGTPVHPEDPIGGMCTGSIDLWILYITTRIREAARNKDDRLLKESSTKAYELALGHAGFGFSNHTLWKNYLQMVKSQTDSNSQQMLTLRNIYQRLVCHPMTGLDQLWQEYEAFERQQSEALAAALLGEYTPKYQHARTVYLERNRVFNVQELQVSKLATPPNPQELPEEHACLQLWKTRTAYERTNPERLAATDLGPRVRTTYKEMACVWTQHPEVWHMWSQWEETTGTEGVQRAIAVLQTAQRHIPDCTLLAQAQAQLLELHTPHPKDSLKVMQAFLERAPNTLGYALYQQMVRRYQGKEAARTVFAKARRVLNESQDGTHVVHNKKNTDETADDTADAADSSETKAENGKRWMVTNRLDESVGTKKKETMMMMMPSAVHHQTDDDKEKHSKKFKLGAITWHLYASHATIEHRLNHAPAIAARVYELGLRKHASFLTQPAYVLRYAQLLLELQDTVNLRALLTRALAACQDSKSPAVTALWDMALQFESLVSIGDPTNVAAAVAMEMKRRAALMGPEVEDVATGFRAGMGDTATIGAQKSTIAEQLVRQDGYDISSSIINGMSRKVDALDIMGLWGNGTGSSSRFTVTNAKASDEEDVIPGGQSDAAYQKRLQFAQMAASGGSGVDTHHNHPGDNNTGSSKLLSARERLQTTSGAPASQNTAITMAIQNSPEWLRALLLLLPASRLRTPVLSKPPPHLTEMALAALRRNTLPAERPQDDKKVTGNKHARGGGGGDSSDEETGARGSGGYGTQFRARQRARQMAAQSNGIKSEQ
jgi:hypothetical protein